MSCASAEVSFAIRINISTVGKCFAAFLNGNADLMIDLVRKMNKDQRYIILELNERFAEKFVSAVEAALATSSRNPIQELAVEQVCTTFSGREAIRHISLGGPPFPDRKMIFFNAIRDLICRWQNIPQKAVLRKGRRNDYERLKTITAQHKSE